MADPTPSRLIDAFLRKTAQIDLNADTAMTYHAALAADLEERLREDLPPGDRASTETIAVGPLLFRLEFAECREVPASAGRILLLRRWMATDADLTAVSPVVPALKAATPRSIEAVIAVRLIPGLLRDLAALYPLPADEA